MIYVIGVLFVINELEIVQINILGKIVEWSLALVLINFFVFLNFFNNFYDSVHPVCKLVHPQEAVREQDSPVYSSSQVEDVLPTHF